VAMSDKDNEEQANMTKRVTEQEAKKSLDAVFAACVATQIRAGKSEEEAMRICHASIEKQLKDKLKAVEAQMPVKPKGSKMRKAAGIMLLFLGVFSLIAPQVVADAMALARASSAQEFITIRTAMSPQASTISTILVVFIVGGGICALKREAYWWALGASIASVVAGMALFLGNVNDALLGILYVPLALVAMIFLVKRRSEFGAGKTRTDEAIR